MYVLRVYINRILFIIIKYDDYSSCREDRPRNVYWALGLVLEHVVVRGQGNIDIEVQASEWRKVVGRKGSRRWSKDK